MRMSRIQRIKMLRNVIKLLGISLYLAAVFYSFELLYQLTVFVQKLLN